MDAEHAPLLRQSGRACIAPQAPRRSRREPATVDVGAAHVDAFWRDADQRALCEKLVVAARSLPHPLRNEALVHLLLGTGLTPIEVAVLKIGDYLNSDGSVRTVSLIDRARAYNGRPRPLVFANERVRAAIDNYLDQRRREAAPGSTQGQFRGFAPDAPLILGNDGQAMRVVWRHDGGRKQRICADIHVLCRALFAQAQVLNVTARDLRKLFARALYEMGADPDGLHALIGLATKSPLLRMLPRRRPPHAHATRIVGLVQRLL